MKRTIKLILITSMLAAFTVPVLAQSKDCTDENKAAWYQKYLDNYKGNPDQQKVAFENANLYLACSSAPDDQIATYLKKFVDAYNKVMGAQNVNKQFEDAFKSKNYAEQMRLGKQILATDSDNPGVTIILGLTGLGDPGLLNDSAQYAKKAIELIEAGKPSTPFTKDQALAYLNWTVAKASLSTAPADAITSLLKAAKFNSEVNKKPEIYIDLAAAYENGPRAKLTADYNAAVGPDKTETPQSKLVLENLNQIIDRQIDALARAAALATDANAKKAIMENLTELYKYRNKSDAGLNELVASVLSKPLPEMPTPITQLPTPSSTPGGTAATSAGSSANNSTSTTGKPAGGNSATSTGAQKPAGTGSAKPSPSPTPNRRPNYRRG